MKKNLITEIDIDLWSHEIVCSFTHERQDEPDRGKKWFTTHYKPKQTSRRRLELLVEELVNGRSAMLSLNGRNINIEVPR